MELTKEQKGWAIKQYARRFKHTIAKVKASSELKEAAYKHWEFWAYMKECVENPETMRKKEK